MNFYFLTGSSQGIGLALTKAILENEKNYVIGLSRYNTFKHDRFKHKHVDFSAIESLIVQLPSIFDIESTQQMKKAVLINNAGTLGEVGYMGELEAKELPEIYNINLVAPAILINEFIKRFKKEDIDKLILNISSGAAEYPVDGWSGYCATKSGLNMVGEVIALEQEKRRSNIKIFNLAPGVVDTGMQVKIRTTDQHQFSGVQKFIDLKESQSLADASIVAERILHLLENPENYKGIKQDVREF